MREVQMGPLRTEIFAESVTGVRRLSPKCICLLTLHASGGLVYQLILKDLATIHKHSRIRTSVTIMNLMDTALLTQCVLHRLIKIHGNSVSILGHICK